MRLTTVTACGIIDMSSLPMRPAPFSTLSRLLLLRLPYRTHARTNKRKQTQGSFA